MKGRQTFVQEDLCPNCNLKAIQNYISPKYSKHWITTMAHTIDCECSKMLNHGLNHGLLFSLFKVFGGRTFEKKVLTKAI